ncbi:MAG: hypothetical protein ACI808_000071 [Paraglaciecola sp.]|jgi:hypothetical protein
MCIAQSARVECAAIIDSEKPYSNGYFILNESDTQIRAKRAI